MGSTCRDRHGWRSTWVALDVQVESRIASEPPAGPRISRSRVDLASNHSSLPCLHLACPCETVRRRLEHLEAEDLQTIRGERHHGELLLPARQVNDDLLACAAVVVVVVRQRQSNAMPSISLQQGWRGPSASPHEASRISRTCRYVRSTTSSVCTDFRSALRKILRILAARSSPSTETRQKQLPRLSRPPWPTPPTLTVPPHRPRILSERMSSA